MWPKKEYKSVYDWVEKVIHWELCKLIKFNETGKWYKKKKKKKSETVQENKTYKIV